MATPAWIEGPGKLDYKAENMRQEWKRFKRGFLSWMIGSEKMKKDEDIKLNLLLTFIGTEGQEIYETFEWANEEEHTLEKTIEKFETHFAGKSNVSMARFRFFGHTQGAAGITEFVTKLKSLANDCEFGELRDSLIKDMMRL